MKENEIQNDLASIRSLMERSSKFISLSGLSGILAGVYALMGAAAAYLLLYTNYSPGNTEIKLGCIALVVLAFSIGTGILLSIRKAKTHGQPIWGKISRLLLFNMAVPLITGGLFTIVLITRGDYGIIAPATLIFYGLSLVSASNYTFNDIKFLGICQILLGLIAACYPGYGLLFWAIGFGILHIVYGSVMYLKYDR